MKLKPLAVKALSLASAVVMSVSAVSLNASADWTEIGCLGDLNNDKSLTVADLVLLAQHLTGQKSLTLENAYRTGKSYIGVNGEGFESEEYFITADVNQDKTVDSFDLLFMRRHLSMNYYEPVWQWQEEDSQQTTVTTTSAEPAVTTTTSVSSDYQTETTTTAYFEVKDENFIDAPIKDVEAYLPSQNVGNLVIFYVDFPDCKYDYAPTADEITEISFGEEDTSDSNYPFDSMTAFYKRSSKGVMNLQGKVFRYTAKENVSAYGNDKNKLLHECYQAFDQNENFAEFDGDGDGYIDATLLSVPKKAGDDDWWPCAGPSGSQKTFDGMKIGHLITGNAQIESSSDYREFNSSYLHEMGHCMGLPDYYLYNKDDYEGMHGSAGNELMDVDCSSDFSAVSKLQLGWYRQNQIQIYDSSQGSQTFTLNNAQQENGNCLVIPNGSIDGKYQSEYFVIEYQSNERNNSSPNMWNPAFESGIRVYHVSAELYDNGWWVAYRYASGSEFTNNDDGRRFIRIIDDTNTNNAYNTGDVIDSSISGFKWYDQNGNQSVEPQIKITIGEKSGDSYKVTVSGK